VSERRDRTATTDVPPSERRGIVTFARPRGYRGTSPLPARPELSAADAPPGEGIAGAGRTQPWQALGGLLFIVPLFVVLAFGAGGAQRSVQVLAPLTTFALPVIAMVAFWWEDWPGASLRAGWSGLTDTLIIVPVALALSLVGQLVVARADPRVLFDPTPGAGHVATFPHTMPLAAGVFTVMLQLTLVSEGWPLRGMGRIRAGLTALAISWVVGALAYLLLVGAHDEPVAVPGGLRDLSGPVAPGAYGAWLTAVGTWQLVFFMALRGWPFSLIRRRARRLPAANAAVIACGWATYLVLRHTAGWAPNRVLAVCGSVLAAILVVAMLLEAWPWTRWLSPLPGRTCVLVSAVIIGGLLYALLSAAAHQVRWTRAGADDWVGYAALNALGMAVILHVAIWRRWPVAAGTAEQTRGDRSPAHV
jgi:hypothetical protein